MYVVRVTGLDGSVKLRKCCPLSWRSGIEKRSTNSTPQDDGPNLGSGPNTRLQPFKQTNLEFVQL